MKQFNLDDENEVNDFIETYGTAKGIRLANALGITGKGAKERANALSAYAWNKHTAMSLRLKGAINGALAYEGICDRIWSRMDPRDQW